MERLYIRFDSHFVSERLSRKEAVSSNRLASFFNDTNDLGGITTCVNTGQLDKFVNLTHLRRLFQFYWFGMGYGPEDAPHFLSNLLVLLRLNFVRFGVPGWVKVRRYTGDGREWGWDEGFRTI